MKAIIFAILVFAQASLAQGEPMKINGATEIYDLKSRSDFQNYDFKVTLERRVGDTFVVGDLYVTFENHASECGVTSADDLFVVKNQNPDMGYIYDSFSVFRDQKTTTCNKHASANTVRLKIHTYMTRELAKAKLMVERGWISVNGQNAELVGFE